MYPACAFALLAAGSLVPADPATALWTTPLILLAAMMIAWAAESAQFFISQGFALAILAWLQTLPEFAVEAVIAWRQETHFLIANLTGALRLLTGLAWPMIYFTAAFFYRRRYGRPMERIRLHEEHCVEVVGLLAPLIYAMVIWAKGTLTVLDSVVLVAIYVAYLLVLSRMPAQDEEGIEDLDRIPRSIVLAPRFWRIFWIGALFAGGGALIYYCAEPFLQSLLGVALVLGVPSFVFIQWVAPFVSEFPEKVSAFYWARTIDRAPMALMNMVSSNINQWTLLTAMLPIVFSLSIGAATPIVFDQQQELEILMTIGQSLVGMIFLVNMELVWWEASALFALWFGQFIFSPVQPDGTLLGMIAGHSHWAVTILYFVWFGAELLRIFFGGRKPAAFVLFAQMWQNHVLRRPA